MLVDLTNPVDVRAAIAALPRFLPPDSVESVSQVSPDQQFVNQLWPRIGRNLRLVVKQARTYPGLDNSIAKLATDLNGSVTSVKAAMNGGLSKAIKTAKNAVPGAQGLFVWRHNGTVWEFGMSEEVKAAIDTKGIDD